MGEEQTSGFTGGWGAIQEGAFAVDYEIDFNNLSERQEHFFDEIKVVGTRLWIRRPQGLDGLCARVV